MKATKPGRVIGIALQSFNGSEAEIGWVTIFLNPHFAQGSISNEGNFESLFEEENVSSTQASEISQNVLEKFLGLIKAGLEKLGLFIQNGIARVKELFAERITTKEIQMVDKATGEIYCTWIENGEWVKVKGECGGLTSTAADSNLEETGSSPTTTEATTTEATTTEATTTEATTTEATTTEATSTEPSCTPDWSCTEWYPTPSSIACGETFTQTRTCTDLNECGTEEGKPAEEQEAIGTNPAACGTTSCDASLYLTGECQNTCVEGTCQNCTPTCSCAEGWADCKNDLIDGCEFQLETSTSTCP